MATAKMMAVRPPLPRNASIRRDRPSIWIYVILCLGALIMLYPLVWMVMSSFKPDTAIFSNPNVPPTSLDFEHYVTGWTATKPDFGRYYINSFIICLGAVVGNVLACSLTAYAFARLEFPFRRTLFAIMMTTLMLPSHVVLIPQYILFVKMGLVNTYVPLILPKFLATDTFFIFLMVQFIRKIPRELDEAATIDGCGPFGVFARVIFPLLTPALVTTIIFTFIWTYNDFYSQLIYLTSPEHYTVPLGLRLFIDPTGESSYGALFAMSILSLGPIIGFFIAFQRSLVNGIATTGIK